MTRFGAPGSVTVLGECVADISTDTTQPGPHELALRALPGGGPANTAVALPGLGTPTRFHGRLSHDTFGSLFHSRLLDAGVDLSGSVSAPEPSVLAVAALDESGQATYTFYAEGAAGPLPRTNAPVVRTDRHPPTQRRRPGPPSAGRHPRRGL